ncbi:hypothetical protein SAMN05428983_0530 [Agrobacterium fabrum]|uniref:Twin-arginine translocation pathway signal n=1 Tax=Agrobacterium fabrum TaxID=1176649 RepID=A0A7Z7FLW9_9HYPH|nr:hypothetical protein [Agrobacterium fabrum]SDJ18329.1 hypothetical protein SAMN05428983_0530 [Agrobacterium fabrum]
MNRRTFIKAAVVAASTPTVTAFADTADHVTLSHLIEIHTLAYEADSAEWEILYDLDPSGLCLAGEPTDEFLAHKQRCEDAKAVVERTEAAIFAYQLSGFNDVLTLTRWVHERLGDCKCYFYEDESTVHAIFSQIARTTAAA